MYYHYYAENCTEWQSHVFNFGELYLYLSQEKSPVHEGISLIRRTHEARHFHGYGYVTYFWSCIAIRDCYACLHHTDFHL